MLRGDRDREKKRFTRKYTLPSPLSIVTTSNPPPNLPCTLPAHTPFPSPALPHTYLLSPPSHSRSPSLRACTSASKYGQASLRVHPCGCVCIRACPQTSDATYPTGSSEPSTTRCRTWMQFVLSASHTRSVPSMLPVYTCPRLYCKHVMRASWHSVEASHSSTIHDSLMSAPSEGRVTAPPSPLPRRPPQRRGPSGPSGGPPPRRASTPKRWWAGGVHLDGPCHAGHGARMGWERHPAAWTTVTHPHVRTQQPSRRRPAHAKPLPSPAAAAFTSNAIRSGSLAALRPVCD